MIKDDDLPGACRVQSPSSILTYEQCPRKYYYHYIERLPSGKSIHLIRGSVVHTVLEKIFDLDLSRIPEKSFLSTLRVLLQETFRNEWHEQARALADLGLSPEELDKYYAETKVMIDNFYHYLKDRMEQFGSDVHETFEFCKPQREVLLQSPGHAVRGYIDAIQQDPDGTTVILDYKTSKRAEISPEYRLQLAIYAMLHEEHHNTPHEVGIFFLKHGLEQRLPVTRELIDEAKRACMSVQMKTRSSEINDYPKKPGPLCKWATGQCDYYDICFQGQTPDDYRKKMNFKR